MRIYVLALGLATLLSDCGNPIDTNQKANNSAQLEPENIQLVTQGQKLYTNTCASCHVANLEGQENWKARSANGLLPAPPHDKSGHTWHHADQILFDITKYGPQKYAGPDYNNDMPTYADVLTDAEIIAVLSYIKSRWPENIRVRHDGVNKQFDAIRAQRRQ